MARSKREISAIPTVYAGVQLKSRFEAQAALLFDRLGWKWEYEPHSWMLSSGVNYMPDFYLPIFRAFVECRGYSTERADSQISDFGMMVQDALATLPNGVYVRKYVVFKENDVRNYMIKTHCLLDGCMIAYCDVCVSWIFLGVGEPGCTECGSHSCSITKVAVINAKSGQLTLNGKTVEHWGEVL